MLTLYKLGCILLYSDIVIWEQRFLWKQFCPLLWTLIHTCFYKEQNTLKKNPKWCFNDAVHRGHVTSKSLYCLYQHSIEYNLKSQQPFPWCKLQWSLFGSTPLLTEVLDLLGSSSQSGSDCWGQAIERAFFEIKKNMDTWLQVTQIAFLPS